MGALSPDQFGNNPGPMVRRVPNVPRVTSDNHMGPEYNHKNPNDTGVHIQEKDVNIGGKTIPAGPYVRNGPWPKISLGKNRDHDIRPSWN